MDRPFCMRRSVLDLWEVSLSFLPEDLTKLARNHGTLTRRRKALSGEQLLKMSLVYASVGSFKTAAALLQSSGQADLTSEGLFYRLARSEAFLQAVLDHLVSLGRQVPVAHRIMLVDATHVCGPGATQADFRIHVGYDPNRSVPFSCRVTTNSVGESLELHELKPGDLVIADRGYGTCANIDAALGKGADCLLRVTSGNLRLHCRQTRTRVDWSELEREVPETGAVDWQFEAPLSPSNSSGTLWNSKKVLKWLPVRLIGARNLKGEVVWLVTNLGSQQLSNERACEHYRVRWQVELFFKRLKSLGDLDVQTSRDGPTARAALLAKLILLILTSLIQDEQVFSPYGYRFRHLEGGTIGTKPLEGVRRHTHTISGRSHRANEETKNAPRTAQKLQTQEALLH